MTTETLPAAAPAEPVEGVVESGPTAFALGDAEPVLNRRELLDGLDCWEVSGLHGRYYQPPLPLDVLSKAGNVTSHHSSAFRVKINQLLRDFIPHGPNRAPPPRRRPPGRPSPPRPQTPR